MLFGFKRFGVFVFCVCGWIDNLAIFYCSFKSLFRFLVFEKTLIEVNFKVISSGSAGVCQITTMYEVNSLFSGFGENHNLFLLKINLIIQSTPNLTRLQP